MEPNPPSPDEPPFAEKDLALLVDWLRSRGAPEDRAWIAARQLARRAGQLARAEATSPEEALRRLLARVAQTGPESGNGPGSRPEGPPR